MTVFFARCHISIQLVVAGALALAGPAGIRAADLPESREQLLDLQLRLLEAQAKLDLALWEAREEPPVERTFPLLPNDPQIQAKLRESLNLGHARRREQLDAFVPKVKELSDAARQKWRTTASESLAFQDDAAKAEALYEFDWRENRPPRFELGWFGWLIVLSWLVMLAGTVALCVHELRRGFRHSRRVAALLLLAPCLGSFNGCSAPRAAAAGGIPQLDDEIAVVRQKIEETEKKRQAAERHAETNRDKALNRWQEMLGKEAGDAYVAQEKQAAEDVRRIWQDARLAELLARDARERATQITADRKRLAELIDQSQSRAAQHRWLRIAGCVVFGLLGFAPLLLIRRRVARRLQHESTVCPRCLAEGALATVRSGAKDRKGREMAFIECKKCRFRFPISNLKLPRISFPTAGIKSSGKTQWLLTAFDQVSNGQVPIAAALETDVTQVSKQIKTFLAMLKQGVPPQGTTLGLPEPLTFILRDVDPWGPTRSLASLFDFSGEVMDKRVYDDEFRQRALQMDGFLLFLDPTQIDPAPGRQEALLDVQKEQVTKFYLELCKVRDLEDGDLVRVPVAVCISKFDLLVRHNPIGEQARRKIAELRKLRPERHLTLSLLRQRSELCKAMLPVIFQGWEVDESLRKRFGGNIMYFPMSSVSLVDSELGEADMKRRTHAPYGILEPFLWLLHMQGFCIFED